MNVSDELSKTATQAAQTGLFTISNIANLIIGAFICLFVTSFFAPSLDNWIQTAAVKWLWKLKSFSKHKVAGNWTHRWHVESKQFEPINLVSTVEIRQFRNIIFAQYSVNDKSGKSYTYRMLGRIQNNSVITGTWKDVNSGHRYFGCFQLQIAVNENRLDGYWTGISTNHGIKSGRWEWIRE